MPEKEPDQLSLNLPSDDTSPKSPQQDKDTQADVTLLEWVCHPAKKNMTRTIAVTAFVAVLLVVVYYMTYSVWFTILGFVLLTVSLAAFYFPTRYIFTDKEIIIKSTTQIQRKKWSQYRSYYPDKNGVLLSPFMRPTRLENFRGLYVQILE